MLLLRLVPLFGRWPYGEASGLLPVLITLRKRPPSCFGLGKRSPASYPRAVTATGLRHLPMALLAGAFRDDRLALETNKDSVRRLRHHRRI